MEIRITLSYPDVAMAGRHANRIDGLCLRDGESVMADGTLVHIWTSAENVKELVTTLDEDGFLD